MRRKQEDTIRIILKLCSISKYWVNVTVAYSGGTTLDPRFVYLTSSKVTVIT